MRLLFCFNYGLDNVSHIQSSQTKSVNKEMWKLGLSSTEIKLITSDADNYKNSTKFATFLQKEYPKLTETQINNILSHFFPETNQQTTQAGDQKALPPEQQKRCDDLSKAVFGMPFDKLGKDTADKLIIIASDAKFTARVLNLATEKEEKEIIVKILSNPGITNVNDMKTALNNSKELPESLSHKVLRGNGNAKRVLHNERENGNVNANNILSALTRLFNKQPLTERELQKAEKFIEKMINSGRYSPDEIKTAIEDIRKDFPHIDDKVLARFEKDRKDFIEKLSPEQQEENKEAIEQTKLSAEKNAIAYREIFGAKSEAAMAADSLIKVAGNILQNIANRTAALSPQAPAEQSAEAPIVGSSTDGPTTSQQLAENIRQILNSVREARDQLKTLMDKSNAEIAKLEKQADKNKEYKKELQKTIDNTKVAYAELELKAEMVRVAAQILDKAILELYNNGELTPADKAKLEAFEIAANNSVENMTIIDKLAEKVQTKIAKLNELPDSYWVKQLATVAIKQANEAAKNIRTIENNLPSVLINFALIPKFTGAVPKDIQKILGELFPIMVNAQLQAAKLNKDMEKLNSKEKEALKKDIVKQLSPFAQVIIQGFSEDNNKHPLMAWLAVNKGLEKDKFYLDCMHQAVDNEIRLLDPVKDKAKIIALTNSFDELPTGGQSILTDRLLKGELSLADLAQLSKNFDRLPKNIQEKLKDMINNASVEDLRKMVDALSGILKQLAQNNIQKLEATADTATQVA